VQWTICAPSGHLIYRTQRSKQTRRNNYFVHCTPHKVISLSSKNNILYPTHSSEGKAKNRMIVLQHPTLGEGRWLLISFKSTGKKREGIAPSAWRKTSNLL